MIACFLFSLFAAAVFSQPFQGEPRRGGGGIISSYDSPLCAPLVCNIQPVQSA